MVTVKKGPQTVKFPVILRNYHITLPVPGLAFYVLDCVNMFTCSVQMRDSTFLTVKNDC
ncbi:hypothetical protein GCM10008933_26190 [Paenibacillus motobuensis]|uniref:Uncharacterized protein n=1 Tax=Paenibacillus motobuensis TaxID=295324 RepID=A0ABN0YFW4_9BACL